MYAPLSVFRFFSLASSSLMSAICTPNTARCTTEYSLRSATTLLTIEIGTANEYPVYEPVCEAIAVLMPISSPRVLTSAPPELPGFTAASVWMNDSIFISALRMLMLRALALTMPAVTVDVRLKGLPTANTHSPMWRLSELPNEMIGRLSASIFSRAMSVDGSVPITFASNLRLSLRVTSTVEALSMTWLFVTI